MTKTRQETPGHDQGPLSPSLEILNERRRLKLPGWEHLGNTRLQVTLPSALISFLLLDASVAVYQRVCCTIDGIPRVPGEVLPYVMREPIGSNRTP